MEKEVGLAVVLDEKRFFQREHQPAGCSDSFQTLGTSSWLLHPPDLIRRSLMLAGCGIFRRLFCLL